MLAFIVGVFGTLFLGLVLFVLRKTVFAPVPKVPVGLKLPPQYSIGFPIFGNFVAFASDPLGFIRQAYDTLGGVFTLNLLAENCTFLIGSENHVPFFEATDEVLDQAPVYRFMTPIFGKKIVYDAPINKRRQQMRALGSFLKPALLKKYSVIIAKETNDYLEKHWKESGSVDLLHSMAELIILTASATLLGPECRNELFEEVSSLYEMLDKGLTPLSIFFPNAPLAAHKKRDFARLEMVKLFSKVITARRTNPQKEEQIDILSRLMSFKYKDDSPMTDDEITGLLIATLFAGQHTSSISTTWTTLFLLHNKRNDKKYYDKVLQELVSVEKEQGSFQQGLGVDSEVLASETHLYNCIKESIRIHPPLILLMRRVVKDVVTPSGYLIPKGHRVIVSNAVAQRLPEIFPDPDTWNPDRWSSFDITKLPKYSFIGFGAGIHTCMGEPFAFMQIRAILTVLFSKYEMDLVTPFPEANYDAMVVPPKGPNIVRYQKRAISIQEEVKKLGLSVEHKLLSRNEINKDDEEREMGTVEAESVSWTWEEVQKHTTKEDLWLVCDNKVYDVSNFVDVHQGGDKAILRYAGKDATKAIYGPQHPGTVPTLLQRYLVGKLKA